MKTKSTVGLLALISVAAVAFFVVKSQKKSDQNQQQTNTVQAQNEESSSAVLASNKTLEKSFTFKNLRLYPIRATSTKGNSADSYLSLREALKAKKIKIKETEGGSGEVNTLYFSNVSKDTVYLMSGEIVQGGKQDRVIAEDMIVPPGQVEQPVSVFCVEQGRWQYNDAKPDGEFKEYYGSASMKLREVVAKEKNQSKVWQEVSRSNQKNEVASTTQAYTAQKKSGDYQKKYKEYYDFFKNKFAQEKNIIGVTGVTGKRVIGSDMFASPVLFQRQFPSILSAYVNEAITDGAKVELNTTEVKGYMKEVFSASADTTAVAGKKGKMFKYKGKALHYSTYSKAKKK
ncbi:hypothetical protein BKI52_25745 [marine bacterium AO1-C]|nr:hypothetical protein BKI52_25745 [marine bacterium AO1-C]